MSQEKDREEHIITSDQDAGASTSLHRSDESRRKVSYVLPVYEEADNLDVFHAALSEATGQRTDLDFEFIYVDDGSRDASLEALLGLA